MKPLKPHPTCMNTGLPDEPQWSCGEACLEAVKAKHHAAAVASPPSTWHACAHRADFASAAEHDRDCPAHGVDAQAGGAQ